MPGRNTTAQRITARQTSRPAIRAGRIYAPGWLTTARVWLRRGAGLRTALIARWFPEREFFMRSEGHVRFLRISSRLQASVAGMVGSLVLVWVAVLVWALAGQLIASHNARSLLQREAAVASAQDRVARYRGNLAAVAADLKRRQDFLEKAVQGVIGPIPDGLPKGTVSDSSSETARTVHKISQALPRQIVPEATGLARMEARQIAFVERLTRFADERSAAASGAIRKVGLNPENLLANDAAGEGGPLIRLGDAGAGPLDPRFVRLVASLGRMSAISISLAHVPNTMPASFDYISSGFGIRTDPIAGGAAFHPGLDFKGPIGAPIYAAAAGTVSFTGVRQGYGNCVEISHGHGLITRYAHMSRIVARLGQAVTPGTPIGAIGSTGRSTGPHLHFEVRVNDRPVDPRPFLNPRPAMPHQSTHDQPASGPFASGAFLESKPHVFTQDSASARIGHHG